MKKLPPTETRFAPGHAKVGGRAKGARNKLSLAVLNDLLQVWQENAIDAALSDGEISNGVAALRVTAKEDPAAFARLYANLLPKEIEVTDTLADMPDERIDAVIAYFDARIADELARDASGTGEIGERENQAHKPH